MPLARFINFPLTADRARQGSGHAAVADMRRLARARSMVMCRICLPAWVTLHLMACASAMPDVPGVQIDGMVIENQTHMWVSAVRVLLPDTGGFVSCGNIAPGSMCSTSFPQTAYTGAPVEITWSQAGQIHSTGPFDLQLPDDMDAGHTASVSVVIAAPGSAGAVIILHPE